ncbi:hypothetical protein QUA35_01270 [Microcoleus sp. N9_B2]|uniref:hypothetical protein n=1 Tax=unclassified Microcoleus TaxID=2642155 RepID=UPI002FD43991
MLQNIEFRQYRFIIFGEKEAASDVLDPEAQPEGGSREKEAESEISATKKWMSFQVSDTRIGMNAEQIERVF